MSKVDDFIIKEEKVRREQSEENSPKRKQNILSTLDKFLDRRSDKSDEEVVGRLDKLIDLFTDYKNKSEEDIQSKLESRRQRETDKTTARKNKSNVTVNNSNIASSQSSSGVNNKESKSSLYDTIKSGVIGFLTGKALTPSLIINKAFKLYELINPFRWISKIYTGVEGLIKDYGSKIIKLTSLKLANPETFIGKFIFKIINIIDKFIPKIVQKLFSILLKTVPQFLLKLPLKILTMLAEVFNIAGIFAMIWPYVRGYIKNWVSDSKLGTVIFNFLDGIFMPINSFFDGLTDLIIGIFTGNLQKIKSSITKLWNSIVDLTINFLQYPWTVLKTAFVFVTEFLSNLVGISSKKLQKGIIDLFKIFTSFPKFIYDLIFNGWKSASLNLETTWTEFWNDLKNIFTEVINFFKNPLQNIKNLISNIPSLGSKIPEAISTAVVDSRKYAIDQFSNLKTRETSPESSNYDFIIAHEADKKLGYASANNNKDDKGGLSLGAYQISETSLLQDKFLSGLAASQESRTASRDKSYSDFLDRLNVTVAKNAVANKNSQDYKYLLTALGSAKKYQDDFFEKNYGQTTLNEAKNITVGKENLKDLMDSNEKLKVAITSLKMNTGKIGPKKNYSSLQDLFDSSITKGFEARRSDEYKYATGQDLNYKVPETPTNFDLKSNDSDLLAVKNIPVNLDSKNIPVSIDSKNIINQSDPFKYFKSLSSSLSKKIVKPDSSVNPGYVNFDGRAYLPDISPPKKDNTIVENSNEQLKILSSISSNTAKADYSMDTLPHDWDLIRRNSGEVS